MSKPISFILILLISTAFAGIYGILHDQITYSISPEYYTKFKFIQFGLASQEPEMVEAFPRFCAAYVGILASWWFGLFMGFLLAITALRIPTAHYFHLVFCAILIGFLVTASFSLIGFFYGTFSFSELHFDIDLLDRKNFYIVGTIHNFSYLGGAFSTLISMAFLFWKRFTLTQNNATGITKRNS